MEEENHENSLPRPLKGVSALPTTFTRTEGVLTAQNPGCTAVYPI